MDDEDIEDYPEFMMGSGYFDYHAMAEVLAMDRRVHWPFTLGFKDIVPKFAKDIAFVLHRSLDYQHFKSRFFIALLYLVGFVLLLVPTAKTFFLLSYSFVNL